MPCHLTDIVLAKCYDENNPTTNDYLYFVESKARATSLLPNSKDSAMNDAIDGAMKDNVSRAGKTVTYLISKYAHEEKYDMARKIGRFKDSTEVPYLRFSNAAIVVDKSQLEKQLKNDAKWIDKLPLYFADDFCVFVHGGIDKGLALNKQIDYYMLWAPNNYLDDYRDYDRIIVSGHHAMLNGTLPCIIANTGICIDTGCVFNGKLTAIIMEKGYMRGFCQVKKGAKIMEEIKMNNETLTIMAQAFYGNRTITTIRTDKIDSFILGYIDSSLMDGRDAIDRTIVKVPNTENLVIIYNKYEEDKCKEDEDVTKPTVIIPEKDLTLYSRCIACRLNDDDSFTDIEEEDINIINKYFVA